MKLSMIKPSLFLLTGTEEKDEGGYNRKSKLSQKSPNIVLATS
jgi:hypothetical protein